MIDQGRRMSGRRVDCGVGGKDGELGLRWSVTLRERKTRFGMALSVVIEDQNAKEWCRSYMLSRVSCDVE